MLEQLRDEPPQRQRVRHAPGGEVLEGLVGRGERARQKSPRVVRLARPRPPSGSGSGPAARSRDTPAACERAREACCAAPGAPAGRAKAADQGADRGAVEREVEGDAAHVVALQLRRELADARGLVARADPDVVHVDLVLDRDQVDGAEQVGELDERRVEVLDRLVEGAVVGRVHPRHAQQARQQVRETLAELAHLVGERPVLADARAPEGADRALLRAASSSVVLGAESQPRWPPRAAPRRAPAAAGATRPRRASASSSSRASRLLRVELAQARERDALQGGAAGILTSCPGKPPDFGGSQPPNGPSAERGDAARQRPSVASASAAERRPRASPRGLAGRGRRAARPGARTGSAASRTASWRDSTRRCRARGVSGPNGAASICRSASLCSAGVVPRRRRAPRAAPPPGRPRRAGAAGTAGPPCAPCSRAVDRLRGAAEAAHHQPAQERARGPSPSSVSRSSRRPSVAAGAASRSSARWGGSSASRRGGRAEIALSVRASS